MLKKIFSGISDYYAKKGEIKKAHEWEFEKYQKTRAFLKELKEVMEFVITIAIFFAMTFGFYLLGFVIEEAMKGGK